MRQKFGPRTRGRAIASLSANIATVGNCFGFGDKAAEVSSEKPSCEASLVIDHSATTSSAAMATDIYDQPETTTSTMANAYGSTADSAAPRSKRRRNVLHEEVVLLQQEVSNQERLLQSVERIAIAFENMCTLFSHFAENQKGAFDAVEKDRGDRRNFWQCVCNALERIANTFAMCSGDQERHEAAQALIDLQ